MSITVSTDVFCDVCGCWDHGTTGPKVDKTQALKSVKVNYGWTTRKVGGKLTDLCPNCKDKP